jgi:glycosyltransferase involved in cell wall biosynthesis
MGEEAARSRLRILVIVPALNEERSVGHLVGGLVSAGYDVLVVSDGSHDNTEKVAVAAGARVVALAVNLGVGGAMQTGYIYASRFKYDIAVQMDGDGQHDLASLAALLEPVVSGATDMTIGSRFTGTATYRVPLARRCGMLVCSGLISMLFRTRITDTTSGFRAVNRDLIEAFAQDYPTDYPEVEVLARLRFTGKRIQEVPVRMFPRQYGQSTIGPVVSLYYMLKLPLAVVKNIRLGVK